MFLNRMYYIIDINVILNNVYVLPYNSNSMDTKEYQCLVEWNLKDSQM